MTLSANMRAIEFVGLHWAPVWNMQDGKGMQALFHEQATYTDPFAGTITSEAIPAMITRIGELFPDYVFNLVGTVSEASVKGRRTIALQWRMTGTQATTRKRIDLPGVDFLEFDGEHIAKANTYFDLLTLQRQSGLSLEELVLKV